MPFRHAHWPVLLLFPLILAAFWPGYFGQLRTVPLALHAHGTSAALWLALVAWQAWSIHARRPALHRTVGLALFVVVPLLAGSTLAAVQGGFLLFASDSDPFHATYGARLGLCDLVAIVTLVGLVHHALVRRRNARVHAGAMLATAVLVLPPVLARLLPVIPGFATMPIRGSVFEHSFYAATAFATLLAIWLFLSDRRQGRAFLAAAASLVIGALLFGTLGRSDVWEATARSLVAIPSPVSFFVGVVAAALVLRHGWRSVPARGGRTDIGPDRSPLAFTSVRQ